ELGVGDTIIVEDDPEILPPPEVNLLVNGNFENVLETSPPLPFGWEVQQDPAYSTSVNVGSNGVGNTKNLKLGIAATPTNCGVSQRVAVESGEIYTFYGYGYYSAAPTNGKIARVSVFGNNDDEIINYQVPVTGTFSGSAVAADSSIIRSFNFTPEVEEIVLKIETNGIDRLIRFDNLMLGKKALPSSLFNRYLEDGFKVQNNSIVLGSNVNASSVRVFDLSGYLVRQNITGNATIDLNKLSKGIYIIKGSAVSGDILTKKFYR
ncbi:MAG: T9SS type A sorting domain-containing protein, partial [Bacteroidales bacterium]